MKLIELFFLNLFLLLSAKDLDSSKSEIVSSAKALVEEGYSAKSAKGGMFEIPEPPPDMLMNPMCLALIPPIPLLSIPLPSIPPMPTPHPINPPPITNVNP